MSTEYFYIWPKNTNIKDVLKQLLALEYLPYVCFIGTVGSCELQFMAENKVRLDDHEKSYTEDEYDNAMVDEMKRLGEIYYKQYCALLVSKVEIKDTELFYWY